MRLMCWQYVLPTHPKNEAIPLRCLSAASEFPYVEGIFVPPCPGRQVGEGVGPLLMHVHCIRISPHQQHPREYGGAVGCWVVVGVTGRGPRRR